MKINPTEQIALVGPYNSIDVPPRVANAMDDEFDGNSLDPKWTWINQGSTTLSFGNSLMAMSLPSNGGAENLRMIAQTMPAGTWTVLAKGWLCTNDSGSYKMGLFVRDSATSKVQLFYQGRNQFASPTYQIGVDNYTNSTTYSTTPVANTAFSIWEPLYLKLVKDASNFTLYLGRDAVGMMTVGSVGITSFLASPNQVGLFSNPYNQAINVVWDFFRRIA